MRLAQILSLVILLEVGRCVKGIDVETSLANTTFQCLKNNGITFSFIRGYVDTGVVDPHAVTNFQNAKSVGLQTDVVVFPCRTKTSAMHVN